MTLVGRGLGLNDYGSVVLSGLGSNIVSGVLRVPVCEYVDVLERLVSVGVEQHDITVSVLETPVAVGVAEMPVFVSAEEIEMEVAVVEFVFDTDVVSINQVMDALEC
jgi:hypothetical protein